MKLIILISILAVISGCSNPAGADTDSFFIDEFDISILKTAISSNDVPTVVSQLNLAKHEQHVDDVRKYILYLWNQLQDPHQGVLKDNLVSLNIVDFLSQAHVNGYLSFPLEGALEIARDSVNSTDRQVVSLALGVLGRSEGQQDIEMLINIVQETDLDYVFDSGAMSIIAKCEPAITQRLIESHKLSGSQKKFITNSTLEFREAGLCAYKNETTS